MSDSSSPLENWSQSPEGGFLAAAAKKKATVLQNVKEALLFHDLAGGAAMEVFHECVMSERAVKRGELRGVPIGIYCVHDPKFYAQVHKALVVLKQNLEAGTDLPLKSFVYTFGLGSYHLAAKIIIALCRLLRCTRSDLRIIPDATGSVNGPFSCYNLKYDENGKVEPDRQLNFDGPKMIETITCMADFAKFDVQSADCFILAIEKKGLCQLLAQSPRFREKYPNCILLDLGGSAALETKRLGYVLIKRIEKKRRELGLPADVRAFFLVDSDWGGLRNFWSCQEESQVGECICPDAFFPGCKLIGILCEDFIPRWGDLTDPMHLPLTDIAISQLNSSLKTYRSKRGTYDSLIKSEMKTILSRGTKLQLDWLLLTNKWEDFVFEKLLLNGMLPAAPVSRPLSSRPMTPPNVRVSSKSDFAKRALSSNSPNSSSHPAKLFCPDKRAARLSLSIMSWNVNGVRSLVQKDQHAFLRDCGAEIIFLQETRCSSAEFPAALILPGYQAFHACSKKKGYAGITLLSRMQPIEVKLGLGNPEFDCEGRLITAEYDHFYVVGAYVPNSGDKLVRLHYRLQWNEAMLVHLTSLNATKPVIYCGDLNVAHKQIDSAIPLRQMNAGCSACERDDFSTLLESGFVDCFRFHNPTLSGAYTSWSYAGDARSRNEGWRFDYFIISRQLLDTVRDVKHHNLVYGSDHCPISLSLEGGTNGHLENEEIAISI